MNLMISETLRVTYAPAYAGTTAEILCYATADSTLGRVLAARSAKGVCAILIGAHADELETKLAALFPDAVLIQSQTAVDDLASLIHFVSSPAEGLHLKLDMRGTPFQRRVWEKVRAIPMGKTVTCMELARWIGPLTSARAVADACAANPIALAIPCHRVTDAVVDLALAVPSSTTKATSRSPGTATAPTAGKEADNKIDGAHELN